MRMGADPACQAVTPLPRLSATLRPHRVDILVSDCHDHRETGRREMGLDFFECRHPQSQFLAARHELAVTGESGHGIPGIMAEQGMDDFGDLSGPEYDDVGHDV